VGARTQVVEQAYDAFGRGDIPAILELLDDGVEWTAPATLPQGGSYKGREEVGSFFAAVGSAFERLEVEPEGMGEVGDELVVAVVRLNGTRRGGGPAGWGAVHAFSVRDGRITRFREYTDLDAPLG
jgi:ketosteroid isomerase-like protein